MAESDSRPMEPLRSRTRRSSFLIGLGWPLSEWTLVRNFEAMPKLLKWLSALGLLVGLLIIPMLIPGNTIRAFGRNISTQEWWLSGAAWIFACTYGLMPVSAVLMLRRSIHGRSLYVTAFFAANACGPLLAWLLGSPVLSVLPSFVFGSLALGLVALYLGRNRAVKAYFEGRGSA